MLVVNMNNAYFLKQNDTATDIELQVQTSNGLPFDLSTATKVEIVIGTDLGRVLVKTPTLLPGVGVLSFGLDEGDLLPTGDNFVEVHIYTEAGEKHVAPSKGHYKLKVERAIDEMQQEVTTYTLDYFLREVRQATQSVEAIVAEGNELVAELRPMKGAIETATVKAELAAATASQSAKDADAAETKALAAEQKANTAATKADTAATSANTAAGQASTAASNANKARTETDAAAARANAATMGAESAATRANTAAGAIEGWTAAEEWTNTKAYKRNNIVTFNGSTWQAKRNNTGMQPVQGDDWTILAQRGVDGEGAVSSVNGIAPDEAGNVQLDITSGTVRSVNGEEPDASGNVEIDTGAVKTINGETPDIGGDINLAPTHIGLGNVDNTSDMNKPVSTAQRAAIDAAKQEANNYTDVQVQGLAADGIPKLVSHEFLVSATAAGQRDYAFTDVLFNATSDTVLVFFDGEALNKAEYTVTKGTNNVVTVRINDTSAVVGSIVRVLIFRNVPVGPDGSINAAVLMDDTITSGKLHRSVLDMFATNTRVDTVQQSVNAAHNTINDIQNDIDTIMDDELPSLNTRLENISLTPGPQGPEGPPGPPGPAGTAADIPLATQSTAGIIKINNNQQYGGTDTVPTSYALNEVRKYAVATESKLPAAPSINATLQNGWRGTVLYYKDSGGIVYVYVDIYGGTTTPGTTIFVLPVGYRPDSFYFFPMATMTSGTDYTKMIRGYIASTGFNIQGTPLHIIQGHMVFKGY